MCGWLSTTRSRARTSRPIEFGADLVTQHHEVLNGHSDSVGGIVVAVRDDDIEWLRFVQNAEGAILSPFDSFLVLRGTKTLTIRMQAHNANGLALAEFLSAQPKVRHVYYPGLPSHPQHELAKSRCAGSAGCWHSTLVRSRQRAGCSIASNYTRSPRPRRRRDADLAPGLHDPRVGPAGTARGDWDHRRPCPHFGRHRGHRRSEGGSPPGPRAGVVPT